MGFMNSGAGILVPLISLSNGTKVPTPNSLAVPFLNNNLSR